MDDVDAFLASLEEFTSPALHLFPQSGSGGGTTTTAATSSGNTSARTSGGGDGGAAGSQGGASQQQQQQQQQQHQQQSTGATAARSHGSNSGTTQRRKRQRPSSEDLSASGTINNKNNRNNNAANQSAPRGRRPRTQGSSHVSASSTSAAAAATQRPGTPPPAPMLLDSDEDGDNNNDGVSTTIHHSNGHHHTGHASGSAGRSAGGGNTAVSHASGEWACPRCTLINVANATVCDACEGPRPAAAPPAGRNFPPSSPSSSAAAAAAVVGAVGVSAAAAHTSAAATSTHGRTHTVSGGNNHNHNDHIGNNTHSSSSQGGASAPTRHGRSADPVSVYTHAGLQCPACSFVHTALPPPTHCDYCRRPLPALPTTTPAPAVGANHHLSQHTRDVVDALPSTRLPSLGGGTASNNTGSGVHAAAKNRSGGNASEAVTPHPPPPQPPFPLASDSQGNRNGTNTNDTERESSENADSDSVNDSDSYDDDDTDESDGGSDVSGASDPPQQQEQQQQQTTEQALDNKELVRFLASLESVPCENLPCAPQPPTMAAHGSLRPFQLQAVSWMLQQENGTSASGAPGGGGGGGSGSGNGHSTTATAAASSSFSHSPSLALLPDAVSGDYRQHHGSMYGSSGSGTPADLGHDFDKRDAGMVRGGILADYMGLGKTRTVIAVCESTRCPAGRRLDRVTGSLVVSAATLIVCPTSLLSQWAAEIRRCVSLPAADDNTTHTSSNRHQHSCSGKKGYPSGGGGNANNSNSNKERPPRVLLYHGARRHRLSLFQVAQDYDYVLTTYACVAHEKLERDSGNIPAALAAGPRARGFNGNGGGGGFHASGGQNYSNNNTSTRRGNTATAPGALHMIQWHRIVLDEAHYIRNGRTRQSRMCLRLTGARRWAVTATPVQNSLSDIFPILKFLRVPHFGVAEWWNRMIVGHLNQDPHHPRAVTALRLLFGHLLLRRTPSTLVHGAPILQLPPKEVRAQYVALSPPEQRFYEDVHRRATEKLDVAVARGSQLSTFSTAFEMLIRCRQACLHPYIVVAALRRCYELRDEAPAAAAGEKEEGGGETTREGALASGGGGGNTSTSHANSSDSAAVAAAAKEAEEEARKRREAEAAAAAEREKEHAFITAANKYVDNVLRKRLRAAGSARGAASTASASSSSFVQELIEELRTHKLEERECIICLDSLNPPAILPCAHTFCVGCIAHALEVNRVCPLCKVRTRPADVLEVPSALLSNNGGAGSDGTGGAAGSNTGNSSSNHRRQGREEAPSDPAAVENTVLVEAQRVDVSVLANWPLALSSKTQHLLSALTDPRAIPPGDKVVVFSSFTTYLQYTRHVLEKAGIPCALFTGKLTIRQKERMLAEFAREDTGGEEQGEAGEATAAALTAAGAGSGSTSNSTTTNSNNASSLLPSSGAPLAFGASAGFPGFPTFGALNNNANSSSNRNTNNSSNNSNNNNNSNKSTKNTAVSATAAAIGDADSRSRGGRPPRVLLATIATCGVGLNLTCANHCFLMEPFWNPGMEEQALNRVHRIGQTKPVTVTRLIAAGTVEEKIEQLCVRKRALSEYCFFGGSDNNGGGLGGGGGASNRLRADELLELFGDNSKSSSDGNDNENSSSSSSSSSSDDGDAASTFSSLSDTSV